MSATASLLDRPAHSRYRVALFNLVFGYVRYAVVFVSAFITLPLVLRNVDSSVYARWLVAMEAIGYLGFVELGVASIVPWLVAERVGRNDRDGLRRLMPNVWACGGIIVALYLVALTASWSLLPERFAPPGADAAAGANLKVGVLLVAAALPLAVFGRLATCVLSGFQDVPFLAAVSLSGDIVAVALTVGLVYAGAGPIGLAVGVVTPGLWSGFASMARLASREPGLVFLLPRPQRPGIAELFRDGFGAWLGGVGGRLTLGSNALLLTLGGARAAQIVAFTCTAKLSDMLTQQAWQVTDSGLVGLAQVNGAGDAARLRKVTRLMVRLALVAGGGAALIVLAVNPAFVGAWLGTHVFTGSAVNIALAAALVVGTLTHAQAACASVLGRRLKVGVLGVVIGLAYASTAVALGWLVGVVAIPAAGVLVGLGMAVWTLGRLVTHQNGVTIRELIDDVVAWVLRASVPLAAASLLGASDFGRLLFVALPAAAIFGLSYLWMLRSFFDGLPIPDRLRAFADRFAWSGLLATQGSSNSSVRTEGFGDDDPDLSHRDTRAPRAAVGEVSA